MAKKLNLINQVFGRLKVQRLVGVSKRHETLWLCKCICGRFTVVNHNQLRSGDTISCGCFRLKHGHNLSTFTSPTYNSWHMMKQRCLNSNNPNYCLYGAKGIGIYNPWYNFTEFLKDMGKRTKGTTLDRINNDGNYSPSNCRWAKISEQNSNRHPYTKRWFRRPKGDQTKKYQEENAERRRLKNV